MRSVPMGNTDIIMMLENRGGTPVGRRKIKEHSGRYPGMVSWHALVDQIESLSAPGGPKQPGLVATSGTPDDSTADGPGWVPVEAVAPLARAAPVHGQRGSGSGLGSPPHPAGKAGSQHHCAGTRAGIRVPKGALYGGGSVRGPASAMQSIGRGMGACLTPWTETRRLTATQWAEARRRARN